MIKVSEEEFHEMMEEAIETIPEAFKDKIENLAFIVEPYPSEDDMDRLELSDQYSLLGLYSGIPYTGRSTWYTGVTPDRIILFQNNIQMRCDTMAELKEMIRQTVVHEVAHYFGMNEDEVRAAGY
jgi:predicted Zn-dependent protease with MMP-like domain